MEKPMFQQLLEAAVHPDLDHVIGVDPQLPDGIEIGQLDPVNPFHRQNASAGDLAVDAGNGNAWVMAVQVPELFGVSGLVEVIHLLEDPPPEFVDQGDQIAADQPDVAVQPGRDVADDVEVKGDLFAKPWALNFDGHLLAVVQNSPMNLTQGCGGDGIPLQFRVKLSDWSPEVLLDACHGQIAVKARQLILKLGELLQQQRRNDVRARGQGLTGLDECRTEVHQQLGTFPCSCAGTIFVLQQLKEPVEADSQKQ